MGAIGYVGQAVCFFSALNHASAGLVALLTLVVSFASVFALQVYEGHRRAVTGAWDVITVIAQVANDHAFRSFLPDTPSGVVRDSWHNGIGAGLRMYLKGVVLPLLGVDVAYGFESEAVRVYLSIGSVID